MSIVTFRAVSIGVLGGLAAFLILGPASVYGVQLFALFVGWAGFYHFGGKLEGLRKTVVHYLFGAALGWLALVVVTQLPYGAAIGLPAFAGIAVAITLGLLVLASKLPALSDFSVAILGYAAVLGLALGDNRVDKILVPSLENPLVIAAVSLIVGAILGFVSETLAEALRKYVPLRGPRAQSATSA